MNLQTPAAGLQTPATALQPSAHQQDLAKVDLNELIHGTCHMCSDPKVALLKGAKLKLEVSKSTATKLALLPLGVAGGVALSAFLTSSRNLNRHAAALVDGGAAAALTYGALQVASSLVLSKAVLVSSPLLKALCAKQGKTELNISEIIDCAAAASKKDGSFVAVLKKGRKMEQRAQLMTSVSVGALVALVLEVSGDRWQCASALVLAESFMSVLAMPLLAAFFYAPVLKEYARLPKNFGK